MNLNGYLLYYLHDEDQDGPKYSLVSEVTVDRDN